MNKKKSWLMLTKHPINMLWKKKTMTNFLTRMYKLFTSVVKNLELGKRVFETTKRSAFITLKDHKENFVNDPKVRLLNPCKPELGKISKTILETIISVIRAKVQTHTIQEFWWCNVMVQEFKEQKKTPIHTVWHLQILWMYLTLTYWKYNWVGQNVFKYIRGHPVG